jgi:hypothetical protein
VAWTSSHKSLSARINNKKPKEDMRKLHMAIMAASLAAAMSASATIVGDFTTGPGHSWVVSWLDGNYAGPVDALAAVIVGGGASFDAAFSSAQAGWSGTLVNSTYTYVTGPASSANQSVALSFAGVQPAGGVVVDIFTLFLGNVVVGQAWQWTDLPNGPPVSNWNLVPESTYNTVVPEPTTMVAGALLLLPFGASALRMLRKSRTA